MPNQTSVTPIPDHPFWGQTFRGKAFDFVYPEVSMVDPFDIAHGLSLTNRFGGHTIRPYSVAQHSLLVVELLKDMEVNDPKTLLYGLLHDATEAYLGDIISPLKQLLPDYQVIESRVWKVCAARFNLSPYTPPLIKRVDQLATRLEAYTYLPHEPLGTWAERNPLEPGSTEERRLSRESMQILNEQKSPQEWSEIFLNSLQDLHSAMQDFN